MIEGRRGAWIGLDRAMPLVNYSARGALNTVIGSAIAERINSSLLQVSFFVIPTSCVFVVLGDLVVGALFQTGQFNYGDTLLVWAILAASSIALLPGTQGRLYSSAFYALRDPDTPLKFAMVRVAIACLLGSFAALKLPDLMGVNEMWGAVFLSAATAVNPMAR